MPITDKPIGSIMIAVAVLLTHILRKAVASMIPAICRFGFSPIARKVSSAIRRCRFHFCMARPRVNPPRERKMIGLSWGDVAWLILPKPRARLSTLGYREVAGMG